MIKQMQYESNRELRVVFTRERERAYLEVSERNGNSGVGHGGCVAGNDSVLRKRAREWREGQHANDSIFSLNFKTTRHGKSIATPLYQN
jgi:hypothetical protein